MEPTHDQSEQSSPWERPALASGIAYVVAHLAAVVVFTATLAPQMPAVDAPPAQFAAHYADHATSITVNNFLLSLPVLLLLPFLGGLFGVLRRAEGGSGALAIAAVAGGVAMAMFWPLGILISGLGTAIAQDGGDAATIKALDGMAPLTLALSAVPRTVLLGAASALLLRGRIAPGWLGWSGVGLALVSIVSSAVMVEGALFPVLALGTLLCDVWILALAVALLRRTQPVSRIVPSLATV